MRRSFPGKRPERVRSNQQTQSARQEGPCLAGPCPSVSTLLTGLCLDFLLPSSCASTAPTFGTRSLVNPALHNHGVTINSARGTIHPPHWINGQFSALKLMSIPGLAKLSIYSKCIVQWTNQGEQKRSKKDSAGEQQSASSLTNHLDRQDEAGGQVRGLLVVSPGERLLSL